MRLPFSSLAPLLLFACAIPVTAQAQSIPEVQRSLSAVLGDIERNLVDREAIEMNFKDWQSRDNSFNPRLDEYNRRMDEANAFCRGTFENDEYVRRTAQCDSIYSQLATLKAQLEPERVNLEEQLRRLQQREADRAKAADAIQLRVVDALKQLTFACALLSNEEYAASCHVPAAPGPRTRDIVARLNADIAGRKPQ